MQDKTRQRVGGGEMKRGRGRPENAPISDSDFAEVKRLIGVGVSIRKACQSVGVTRYALEKRLKKEADK